MRLEIEDLKQKNEAMEDEVQSLNELLEEAEARAVKQETLADQSYRAPQQFPCQL